MELKGAPQDHPSSKTFKPQFNQTLPPNTEIWGFPDTKTTRKLYTRSMNNITRILLTIFGKKISMGPHLSLT